MMISSISRRPLLKRLSVRSVLVPMADSAPLTGSVSNSSIDAMIRPFSSSGPKGGGGKQKTFRPRRRPSSDYRPIQPPKKPVPASLKSNANNPLYDNVDPRVVELGNVPTAKDDLEREFGPLAADVLRDIQKDIANKQNGVQEDMFEQQLRLMDYLGAETGSTEDLVGARRALATDLPDEEERKEFVARLDALIRQKQQEDLLGDNLKEEVEKQEAFDPFSDGDEGNEGEMDHETYLDPNQLAHGEWSEMLVKVDRTTKLWRGGRLESYRALVIGGNLNGCGGFGIGKSGDPLLAVDIAGRMCKRNIFFVDRYQGDGLTRDLVGKQNSCKLLIRATDNGLRGNQLACEILKRFGITNAVVKAHGNRNPYNVVRATFKALMTHESIEDIALKRGKRIVSIDRAMRMQV